MGDTHSGRNRIDIIAFGSNPLIEKYSKIFLNMEKMT